MEYLDIDFIAFFKAQIRFSLVLIYSWGGEAGAHGGDLFFCFCFNLFVAEVREHFRDERGDFFYFPGAEASGSDSWCTQPDAAASLRWLGVKGDGILVYQDTNGFKSYLGDFTGYSSCGEVNEDNMIISAPRDQAETILLKLSGKNCSVF